MAPPRRKKYREPDEDDDEDISQLRKPITLHGKPVEQILNSIHYGSPELRNLLLYECDMILECKVCHALFRDVPNFISHKRRYCCKSTAENNHFGIGQLPDERVVVVHPQSSFNKPETVDSSLQNLSSSSKTRSRLEDSIQRIHDHESKGKTRNKSCELESNGVVNFISQKNRAQTLGMSRRKRSIPHNSKANVHPESEDNHDETSECDNTNGMIINSSSTSTMPTENSHSESPVILDNHEPLLASSVNTIIPPKDEQKMALDSYSHSCTSSGQDNMEGNENASKTSLASRSSSPSFTNMSRKSSRDSLEALDMNNAMESCDKDEEGSEPLEESLPLASGDVGEEVTSISMEEHYGDDDDGKIVNKEGSVTVGNSPLSGVSDDERDSGSAAGKGLKNETVDVVTKDEFAKQVAVKSKIKLRPRRKIKVPVRNIEAMQARLRATRKVSDERSGKKSENSLKGDRNSSCEASVRQRCNNSPNGEQTNGRAQEKIGLKNGVSWVRFYNDQFSKVTKCIDLKRLACLKCLKIFNYEHNLRRHVLTQHMDVLRFQCKVCGLKAFNKADISRHLVKTHRNVKTSKDYIINIFNE